MRFSQSRNLSGSLLAVLIAITGAAAESVMKTSAPAWKQLAPVPDAEGFAFAFAGVSHDALLVAGGANFPGKRPWEGGAKVWYDDVFVLESPDGVWRRAGKLPRPNAYGVSFTTSRGVVCAGGGDAKEHLRDVFLLAWDGKKLATKSLPALPGPLAFGSGAAIGDTIYLCGGLARPDATTAANIFWKLDLTAASPAWEELPACPGPARMLAQVGVVAGKFYVCGGASLYAGADGKAARTYLRDAYVYEPGSPWRKLADMPHGVAGAPSPMPVSATGELLVISGDDGTRAHLNGPNHPGFLREVLVYDPSRDAWSQAAQDAPISRATAPTAWWRGSWIVASGEKKPGYRSPEIWSVRTDG